MPRMTFDKDSLRFYKGGPGQYHIVAAGPYGRHGNIVVPGVGMQKATFADGQEYFYSSLVGLLDKAGNLNPYGAHVIPRLPNGDVLMVGVNRPAMALIPDARRTDTVEFLDGRLPIYLGATKEIEFPGGTVNRTSEGGEGVKVGALREGLEELGLAKIDDCPFIARTDRIGSLISEFAIQISLNLIDLPEQEYPSYVENDGGLSVVRLSQAELKHNKRRGLFTTGSTHSCLRFLADLNDPDEYRTMLRMGEIVESRETFRI